MNRPSNEYMRNYYKTHPEQYIHLKALIRENRLKTRLECEKKIGNKCIICGSQEKLSFHEINGKPHYTNRKDSQDKYYLENYQDFVPLCQKHHRFIHFLAKSLSSEAELDKSVELIKKLMR